MAPQVSAPPAHCMSPSPVSAAYSAETLTAPTLASQVSSQTDGAVRRENLPLSRLDVDSVMVCRSFQTPVYFFL